METAEKWIDVPGLGGAFQFSDKGHIRQMARMQRAGKHTRAVFACEVKSNAKVAWCDYETGAIGFNLWFNGRYHFVARDNLVALFGTAQVEIDDSRDELLRKVRNEAFERNSKKQKENDNDKANRSVDVHP